MSYKKRVVVTGMGTVNPIGQNVTDFWKNCCKGTSGIRMISDFQVPDEQSKIAGMVDDFIPPLHLLDVFEGIDRSTLFALTATKEALESAGFGSEKMVGINPKRSGVFLSTAISQVTGMTQAFLHQTMRGRKPIEAMNRTERRQKKEWARDTFHFNAIAKNVAKQFNLYGGFVTITTGCTGGLDAIGYAIDAIRSGDVDVAITGSTDAPIIPLAVAAFSKIGATSMRNGEPQKASRPFDKNRDGFVLGEGCGILVLESLEHAKARGANIIAEFAGFGSVNNCYHMTDIPENGSQIARSATLAMKDSGVTANEIDSINAHGSSTAQNDIAEANAYWSLFGERAAKIPVTSIKSQIGHPLSASNSIEVISSIMSISKGIIPPTINLEEQDPKCKLDVVGNEARFVPTKCVLKTSSGFSGIHSSLIIRQYEG